MPLKPFDQWSADYDAGVSTTAELTAPAALSQSVSPDPVVRPIKSFAEWSADYDSGKVQLKGAPPSTINKPITDEPTSKVGGIVKNLPETMKEIGLDLFGVHAKVAAAVVKGATLGAIDAEQGTIGVPFSGDKKKVGVPLPLALKIMGVSPEIADNPDIGTGMGMAKAVSMGAEAVGVPAKIAEHPIAQGAVAMLSGPESMGGLMAWSGISKAVGVMGKAAAMTPEATLAKAAVAKFTESVPQAFGQFIGPTLKIAGRVTQESITGALFGLGHVRGPDEDPIVNALTGATWGAGGALGLEAFGTIGKSYKVSQIVRLKNDLADILYESGQLTEEAAQHQAARVVTNTIYKKGGLGEISVADIKEAQATARETFEKIKGRRKAPTEKASETPVDTTGVAEQPKPVTPTEIVPAAEVPKPVPVAAEPLPVKAEPAIAAVLAEVVPETAPLPTKIEAEAPPAEIAKMPEPITAQKGISATPTVRSVDEIRNALEQYRKTGEFPPPKELSESNKILTLDEAKADGGYVLPPGKLDIPPREGKPYLLLKDVDPSNGKKVYDLFGASDNPLHVHKGTFYEGNPNIADVPIIEGIKSPMQAKTRAFTGLPTAEEVAENMTTEKRAMFKKAYEENDKNILTQVSSDARRQGEIYTAIKNLQKPLGASVESLNKPSQPLSGVPSGAILKEETNAIQRTENTEAQNKQTLAGREGSGGVGTGGSEALAPEQAPNVPIASKGGNTPQDINKGGDETTVIGERPSAEPSVSGVQPAGSKEPSPPADQSGTSRDVVAQTPSDQHRNNVRSIIDEDYTKPEKTPEETLTGGNSGGSFASKGGFAEDFSKEDANVPTYEGEEHTELGGVEHIKPMEMPEIVELAKEINSGKVPEISSRMGKSTLGLFSGKLMRIRLRPEIFSNPKLAAQVLAHELGHLIDYLPDHTMARGNIIGRLKALTRFLRNRFGEEEITNKELKAELVALSEWWRPYDKAKSALSFQQYRNSPAELYADAISVLFNAPFELETRAPKFYGEFFKNLDEAKPEIKTEFFNLMDALNRPEESILKHRQENIENAFVKAADIWQAKRHQNDLGRAQVWERLRQLVDDVFAPITKRQNQAEANGIKFDDAANPRFAVDELGFADNVNRKMLRDVQEHVRDITKDHVTDQQLGAIMFLERVMADRSGMANPGGQTPETAQKGLDYLKKSMTPEAWGKAQQAIHQFHDLVFEVVQFGVENGVISRDNFETKIKPNKYTYAAFRPLDYVENYVTPGIKAQVGTLKDIESPFVTTILKMIALNRVSMLQISKNAVKGMLKEHFAGEISKAKPIVVDGVRVNWKKEKDMDHLEILEDGKPVAYNVDPAIARAFKEFSNHELKMMAHHLRLWTGNKFFRGAWITYNLGFGAYTNPIRDLGRSFKMLPEPPGFDLPGKPFRTAMKLAKEYIRNAPTAWRRANGVDDAIIKEMEDLMALAPNFVDVAMNPGDDQVVHELKSRGIIPEKAGPLTAKQKAMKPLLQLMHAVQFLGSFWETLGKVSSYQYRKSLGETGKSLAFNTRNYSGTPNWRRQGSFTPISNEIFMFSNIAKEDWKSNYERGTNPKTRSGYWWKTLYTNIIPKMMMRAAMFAGAAAGASAGAKALKELFDRIPENDKTNYICIPLGKYTGGDFGWKTVYLRIPHDDFGRQIAGVFWKITGAAIDKNAEGWHDIFNIVDNNLPGVNSGAKLAIVWDQYLSGQNPYDTFRGRGIMTDDEHTAGGWPAIKKMVQWTVSQSGQVKIATYSDSTKSTTERILEATPGLNAALKISDYGLKEKERSAAAGPARVDARERIVKREVKQDLLQKLRTGDLTAAKDLGIALGEGKLSPKDLKKLVQEASLSQFQNRIKNMPLDQAVAVYNAMGDEEKKAIGPIIGNRMAGAIDRGNIDQIKKIFKK